MILTIVGYTLLLIPIGFFVIANVKPEKAKNFCDGTHQTCLNIVDALHIDTKPDRSKMINTKGSRNYREPSAFE
jgi:hypothetical protein